MQTKWKTKLGLIVMGTASIAGLAASADYRLVEAAKQQNKKAVRALLAGHVDVNAIEENGAAIHWAAHWDDHETAELLIRAGAHVNAVNQVGLTPLILACENASAAMVKRLLQAGAKPNLATANGETPLMECSRTGSPAAVEALLEHGANVNARESLQDQTALMWAAAEVHPDVVRMLLKHGADVHARSRSFGQLIVREETGARLVCPVPVGVKAPCVNAEMEEKGGSTPLIFAARSGDVESAKLLIAAGADVNETAPNGNSVLVIAAYSSHPELAELLLQKDASPNAVDGGYAAMHVALLRGNIGLVKSLLNHSANPNIRIVKGTPHMRSSQQFGLPNSLIGATPFFLATKFLELDAMRTLIAAGADPLLPTQNGTTPLMAAAGIGYKGGETRRGREHHQLPVADEDKALEAVKLALSLGADINAVSDAGDTALHGAAAKGYREVARFLVENGANLEAKNKRGQTPLSLAKMEPNKVYAERDRKGTETMLRQLGAKDVDPANPRFVPPVQ